MFGQSRSRQVLSTTILTSLVAAPFAVMAPAQASPAGDQVVISEVYGAGGNSGASFNADFVELYNPTIAPIDLSSMSVQYRSSGGTADPTGVVPLSGSLAAGDTLLVQMSAVGATGAALPAPDLVATPAVAMSGTAGTVFLANQTTALTAPATGSVTGNPSILDLVGYGASNTFETNPVTGFTNATSVQRNTGGDDSDSNVADLTSATPTPDDPAVAPPVAVDATIEQIQGTGNTSPMVDDVVNTAGLVTAAYPTGGFNGFYLQQLANTTTDANASDGVFVLSAAEVGEVEVGDYVEVTGTVQEAFGLTQVAAATDGVSVATLPDGATVPTATAVAFPDTDAEREALEGMLLDPQGNYTVTEPFGINRFAEIGLATGTTPLVTPTEVADAQDATAIAEAQADIEARALVLDDGANLDQQNNDAHKDIPLPWLTGGTPVRAGAAVTFTGDVVLSFAFGDWRFQPTTRVEDNGASVAAFEDTRAGQATPADVGGEVKIASFNVLNYFTTTGEQYVAGGGTCTFFTDRDGNNITNNNCGDTGPRGAANDANLARQQAKIVNAINALGADVVSLEEIENSAHYGPDRDAALSTLVDALNADAGSDVWEFVPTPVTAGDQTDEDVIRTAFIYKSAAVAPVRDSVILEDPAFDNAREPLAQGFKPVGGSDASTFLAIVNHFKSKGSGVDDGTGQGLSNPDRIAQATALRDFATTEAADLDTELVYLMGDFNSYTQEDPLQVLYDAGYTNIGAEHDAGKYSYVFDGLSGSLDHVLASPAAAATVTDAAHWNINAVESVAYEYSRFNYNVTNFYDESPFRSSDHDPLVVGLDVPAFEPPVVLNLLGINDFHGRIDANTTKFATTVEQLRAAGGEANTLFLSSGDNVGASLFASASADDNPTIDVLNALGLDATSLGNHELDKGFADLTGHISDRADFPILGANVYLDGTTTPALDEYEIFTVQGIRVGVIGAVTEETPTLVSPGGITQIDVGDPAEATNRVANMLSDGDEANGEADVIVATFHEGAGMAAGPNSPLEQEYAASQAFASIVDLDADVDAIYTGHTHKEYVFEGPVPGAPGETRPIVQTGEYGNNVGRIQLTVDPATMEVTAHTATTVDRVATADLGFPRVAAVKTIVDAALAAANEVGKQPVGELTASITTAYAGGSFVDGFWTQPNPADPKTGRDDRANESALGNTVADALVSALNKPEFGNATIGVVNPGGLRDELFYQGVAGSDTNHDGVITYAEANAVLPFVNNLWTVDLTGAQFKKVLEQQWQRDANGNVPSRPFLQLGLSKNVKVVLDPTRPEGSRVASVTIDGLAIDPAAHYKVATFSFLGTGGDNFRAFTEGDATDTGLVDRDAWIEYLGHNTLTPDFARRQVYIEDLPASVLKGQSVQLKLRKLNLTSLGTPEITKVDAYENGVLIGSAQAAAGAADLAVAFKKTGVHPVQLRYLLADGTTLGETSVAVNVTKKK